MITDYRVIKRIIKNKFSGKVKIDYYIKEKHEWFYGFIYNWQPYKKYNHMTHETFIKYFKSIKKANLKIEELKIINSEIIVTKTIVK